MGNALIFIKVYTNLKNGGIFALLGSLVTFLGTYLSTLNTKKEERTTRQINCLPILNKTKPKVCKISVVE